MNDTRKLRFMQPRGYNGVIIARGAVVEVTEPWASRFVADGTAEEIEKPAAKPKQEPPAEKTLAEKKKPAAKKGAKK